VKLPRCGEFSSDFLTANLWPSVLVEKYKVLTISQHLMKL